jgi:uncharacterized protein (TIGR03435 family)
MYSEVEYDMLVRTLTALLFTTICWSQQPEFEAVSIKLSSPDARGSNFNRMAGGGIRCLNVTLHELVTFAYDIRDQQLIGSVAWMDADHYDILAKTSQNDNPTGAKRSFDEDFRGIRIRMRAVLADRFKLAVHNETREMPIYALMVAKSGSKLTPSTSEDLRINNRNGTVICRKVSMEKFAANTLTYKTGRTVVDKTGLTGEYDFDLKYLEDAAVAAGDTSAPDFLTALREQLGLVLQSQKAPVEVLVIDHAEKASMN